MIRTIPYHNTYARAKSPHFLILLLEINSKTKYINIKPKIFPHCSKKKTGMYQFPSLYIHGKNVFKKLIKLASVVLGPVNSWLK
jgi:hypothetical protein